MTLKILFNAASGKRQRQRHFKIRSNQESRVREGGYDGELEVMMSRKKGKALLQIQPSH